MQRIAYTIPVEFIDTDLQPELTTKYNVRSIPTVVLVSGSVELKRFVGVKNEGAVQDFFYN
jgi:hypothetical protein